jgi:glycosyltransferase involved in cell wall biosynthesis
VKIGLFLSSLGLMRGGLETVGGHLMRRLVERGHVGMVVAGYWPRRGLDPDLASLPVHWTRVPCLPANHPLWRHLGRRRPGLPLKLQSLSFCFACRCHPFARRLVATCDVTWSMLEIETVAFSAWRHRYRRPHISYYPGIIDPGRLRRDRSTLRLAISQMIADRARDSPGLDIHGVLPPGIPAQWLFDTYHVRRNAHTLLFVGRLEANKGLPELLDIFHAVASRIPDVQLRLVGDGSLRPWVEAEGRRHGMGERITCTGPLPPEGVRGELINADLFVFPSRYESWGIAVLEAMAVGVPVLCSEIPALREATLGAARLLAPGEIAEWVAAVSSLLQDLGARKALSLAGRERARQMTWSRVARDMEGYLGQALDATE